MSRREASEAVPLDQRLFREFYGKPPPSLIRGYAGLIDGRVVGVGGVVFMGDYWLAFCDLKDEARGNLRVICKTAVKVRAMIATRCRLPVIAFQDSSEPTAPGFLKHMGFVQDEEGVWRWQD